MFKEESVSDNTSRAGIIFLKEYLPIDTVEILDATEGEGFFLAIGFPYISSESDVELKSVT